MADYILGVNPTVTDATAQFTLGTESMDPRAREFSQNVIRYVKAAGTIAANAAITLDMTEETNEPNAAVATSATGQPLYGVSIVAMNTSTAIFGWITVEGKGVITSPTGIAAARAFLVSTATAGQLDAMATSTNVDAVAIAAFQGVPISSIDSCSAGGTAAVLIG